MNFCKFDKMTQHSMGFKAYHTGSKLLNASYFCLYTDDFNGNSTDINIDRTKYETKNLDSNAELIVMQSENDKNNNL
jgi:hypothetical protein